MIVLMVAWQPGHERRTGVCRAGTENSRPAADGLDAGVQRVCREIREHPVAGGLESMKKAPLLGPVKTLNHLGFSA